MPTGMIPLTSDPGFHPARYLLSESDFRQAVASLPLVSIDLLVEDDHGRYLLGQRRNPPAQGCWFVPGGRVRKDEPIAQAMRRLLREELCIGADSVGLLGPIEPMFRGVYEHFYDTNFANEPGATTHYVVLAYTLRLPASNLPELPLEQHGAYRWLRPEEVLADAGVHAYTKAYFS